MKKLIISLILLVFFTVSCSGSKKAENDIDILPDEDAASEDDEGNDADVIPDEENLCGQFANSSGEYIYSGSGKRCGCNDGYFWANPGCKKITYANICTGASECYDNKNRILCPQETGEFYGQDAQYAKRGICVPQNFSTDDSVSNEPVVSDNNLKIEWSAEDSESLYTWDEAVKYCEELEYAGHNDWRLPEPKELLFFHLLSPTSLSPSRTLWSGTSQANDSTQAWVLHIDDEDEKLLKTFPKTSSYNVQCVRKKTPALPVFKVFIINGNEIVRDFDSGLAWMKIPEEASSWKEALAYCENLEYAGFSDWRLPNRHELLSLVDYEKSNPVSDFPDAEKNFSSPLITSTTTSPVYNESFATISFSDGMIGSELKTKDTDFYSKALCVRNEPCKKNYWWNGEKCLEDLCKDDPCKDDKNSTGQCNLIDFMEYSCGCVKNYFWDDEKCVNPCAPNPCKDDKNSTGECITASIDLYFCKCQGNYFWGGRKCVNPCEEDTCKGYENSTGECTKAGNSFICGCEEGYFWHGSRKGCLNDRPAAVNVCTGQNKCYDNEKEIPCPDFGDDFFGQDAQYAALGYCAPQSFSIDNSVENEPVVIDNNLGLMWQQKIPPVEELYIEDVLAYCENLVYGGYDDWRLPSMEDFMTITDYGRYAPAVNTEYFSDSGSFWTSTMEDIFIVSGPGAYTEYDYTIFDFTEPSTYVVKYYFDWYDYSKTEAPYSFNIRCARGGNAAFPGHHFISETFGKKVMWNNYNDLIFIKADYPYDHLIVETAKYTWKEALKYCSELEYAGISDWRVPNFKELTFNSLGGARTSTTKLANQTSDYAYIYSNLPVKEDNMADTLCVANDPCGKGKFWNGKKCATNPCAGNPCQSFSNSTGLCTVLDEENFACGCIDNYYFWNYDKKECLRSCYDNPCYYDNNSDYNCYDDNDEGYYCGCEENFSWDPESRKCVFDCNTNPCQNMEHSDGNCHENGNDGSYCGCVEGYAWFPNACLEDLCNPNPCENMANSYGTCEQKYYKTNKGYEIYYRCNCIEGYSWNTKYEECRKTK